MPSSPFEHGDDSSSATTTTMATLADDDNVGPNSEIKPLVVPNDSSPGDNVNVDDDDYDDSGHYFDRHFVHQVRTILLAMDLSQFDSKDVDKLLSEDDWFVRRFLSWRPTTVTSAAKTITDALLWRKEININQWKDTDFPSEFYQVAGCFSYLPDRENNNILILRMRYNKKEPVGGTNIENMIRNFFIHIVEKIVSQNPNRGFGIVFDCWKSSLSNVDIDMARFIIATLSNYYSGAISYVYIYELPWILNQIWRLIRSWLDEESRRIIRFITQSNIQKYFDHSNLPDYMGGRNEKDYRFVPKGVLTLEEMSTITTKTTTNTNTNTNTTTTTTTTMPTMKLLGIKSDKDLKRLTEHFQKLIKLQ